MKTIEKKLDRMFQALSQGRKCQICRKNDATATHHVVRRDCKIFRYNVINACFVCNDCHRKIHDTDFNIQPYIKSHAWEYLQEHKHDNYKDWLFEHDLTEDEYLEVCKKELEKWI